MGDWELNRGFCPVNMGTPVDVIYNDGSLGYDIPALFNAAWHSGPTWAWEWGLFQEPESIRFWRPHSEWIETYMAIPKKDQKVMAKFSGGEEAILRYDSIFYDCITHWRPLLVGDKHGAA